MERSAARASSTATRCRRDAASAGRPGRRADAVAADACTAIPKWPGTGRARQGAPLRSQTQRQQRSLFVARSAARVCADLGFGATRLLTKLFRERLHDRFERRRAERWTQTPSGRAAAFRGWPHSGASKASGALAQTSSFFTRCTSRCPNSCHPKLRMDAQAPDAYWSVSKTTVIVVSMSPSTEHWLQSPSGPRRRATVSSSSGEWGSEVWRTASSRTCRPRENVNLAAWNKAVPV